MFTLARPKCQQYLAKYPNITKKPYTAPEMLASAKLENLRIFLSNLLHKPYTTHGAMYSCRFVSLARWEIIPGGHRYLPHAGSITQFIIWLAPRAGKMTQIAMEPSCPLGTPRCIPQPKLPRKPYNKSFIDQVCSVKIAGYWPRSFFASLWTSTASRSINTQKKNSANIQPS